MNNECSREPASLPWRFLLPALIVPLLGSLIYFVWLPHHPIAKVTYGATKVFTLCYPLFFIGWRRLLVLPSRSSLASVVSIGLTSGIVISLMGWGLMATPMGELVREGAGPVKDKAYALGFAQNYLLFAIFVSFFHSALEEFYWRGFVFSKLRGKLGRWSSHILAALAFAAHHLVVTLQYFPAPLALFLALCVAIGGFIWTFLYEKQGNLVGCWLSHLCVDVLLMFIGYQLIFE